MSKTKLCVDCSTDLGESPIWYNGRLYFVDINRKRIYDHDPSSGSTVSLDLPEMVGTIVPRASGGLLACLESTVVSVVCLQTATKSLANCVMFYVTCSI